MKKIFLSLVLALVMIASSVTFVSASAGFDTSNFNVNIKVNEDHTCQVEENIKVNFNEPKHGIFRYVPYENGIYTVKHLKAIGERYETEATFEDGASYKTIKIGDADVTRTGKYEYKIKYDIVAYEDRNSRKDYLALDLLPTNWETPIKASKITVSLPKGIDKKKLEVYSGYYGSNTNSVGVKAKYNEEKHTITISAKNLDVGQGITIRSDLPEGYWVGAANRDWMRYPILGILLAIPVLMILLWFLFGRDPKIVKTVEFYPPEDMSPAEIGYIIDGTVDKKDVISLIMYFAHKGYLTISEEGKKHLSIRKINELDEVDSNKSFARTFFDGLFAKGDAVSTTQFGEKFGDAFLASMEQVKGSFKRKKAIYTTSSKVCRFLGLFLMFLPPMVSVILSCFATFKFAYFFALPVIILFSVVGMVALIVTFDKWESKGKVSRTGSSILGILATSAGTIISALCVGSMLKNPVFGFVVIVSTVITLLCVILMQKRTKQSAKWQGQILGFKNFIETAEIEKLRMLSDEDPSYFYNIMPYAYVMGLESKWAKKFENINIKSPDWYYSNGRRDVIFDAMLYSHMFSHCTSSIERSANGAISKSIAANADSGGGSIGGGFGGGGFSGGGFGGGGGGSW